MKKDSNRRLRYLLTTIRPPFILYLESPSSEEIVRRLKCRGKLGLELSIYFEDSSNIENQLINWVTLFYEQQVAKDNYSKKPGIIRKDNKTYLNTGSGSQGKTIRLPKKCRKTAWKRFYKLFPKLKP